MLRIVLLLFLSSSECLCILLDKLSCLSLYLLQVVFPSAQLWGGQTGNILSGSGLLVQKRYECTGQIPRKGHKGTGGKAERAGTVQGLVFQTDLILWNQV